MRYIRSLTFICILFLMYVALGFSEVLEWDISTYPAEVQGQFDKAQGAFKKEKFAEALRLYEMIAKNSPTFVMAHIVGLFSFMYFSCFLSQSLIF